MGANDQQTRRNSTDSHPVSSISRRPYLKALGGISAAGLTAGCLGSLSGGGTTEISLLVWGGYEQVKADIEEKLDVSLNYKELNSSSQQFSSWNAGNDTEFDLAAPTPSFLGKFVDADLVAPVQEDIVTNWEDVYSLFKQGRWRDQMTDGGDLYGIPTRFGWYSYSYDSRQLPEDHEESYKVLFSEEYEGVDMNGQVVMYDGHFKTMGLTALYLGYQDAFSGSTVSLTDQQLQNVKETMIEQKDLLAGYIASDATLIKSFRQQNHIASNSGVNEIMQMQKEGDDWVKMASPSEGELAWTETFVVSQQSENKEMAWKVANEYLDPEIAAKWTNNNGAPNPNPKSHQYLEDGTDDKFAVEPSRIEGMIPFMRIEDEESWLSAWEEIKAS